MKYKFNSFKYWEKRYHKGKTSGNGSYGKLAVFKAEVINNFIKNHNVNSMIDFGCGDSNQASFFNCQKYVGFDSSKIAIDLCKKKFKGDTSRIFTNSVKDLDKVDLTVSCEVLFHLIDFDIFIQYLQLLFKFSNKYVIIYSSNSEDTMPQASHMKHREFTSIVLKYFPNWKCIKMIPNKYPKECFSDFYMYESTKDG